jgi:hypothetical protein
VSLRVSQTAEGVRLVVDHEILSASMLLRNSHLRSCLSIICANMYEKLRVMSAQPVSELVARENLLTRGKEQGAVENCMLVGSTV